jgi:hypothetical protein
VSIRPSIGRWSHGPANSPARRLGTGARASQATTFGYVGTGLGVLGVLIGLAALLRQPAAPRPSA